jgi:hypothetical protein
MSAPNDLEQRLRAQLNKLAKWRTVFAGWQLGTRLDTDPECQAVKDQRELLMLMRVELNALTRLLLESKAFSQTEYQEAVLVEAEWLDHANEQRFPGFKSTEFGMNIDAVVAAETMRGWKP